MLSKHLPAKPNLESTQFSTLQLPNLHIRILDKLTPSYYFISQLYLDHNALMTLNGIQQFQNLEVFTFNFNHVACLNQLNKIQNKFFLRELSFIGNPMEADVRSRYEVIVLMGFKQLERLNPIGQTKFARNTTRQGKRLESISRSYQQQQGKTERYTPKFSDNQQRSSRKLILKTETNQNIRKSSHFTSAKFHHKSNPNNISTTLNKTHESGTLSIKNRDKPTKVHQNQQNVDINPFQYVDEDEGETFREFQSGRKYEEQLQESPIRSNRENRENNRTLFHETGYFQRSSAYFKSEKDKSFAMEFLEQQKLEIAEAFRARHVKQAVFSVLSKLKYVRLLQETQAKRKALAAVKFYTILNKIS